MKLIDILNESAEQQNINKIKVEFSRRFDKYVVEYTPQLKQASKVIDVFPIVAQIKIHVLNRITQEYPNIVSGRGGDKFAYSVWVYTSSLLNSEIDKMGWIKKQAIKALAGNKDKFMQNSKIVANNSDQLYDFISGVLDIGYIAGSEFVDNMKMSDNSTTYSQQYMDWMSKNWRKMESGVINSIANKLF
jgi:hypothetical protein